MPANIHKGINLIVSIMTYDDRFLAIIKNEKIARFAYLSDMANPKPTIVPIILNVVFVDSSRRIKPAWQAKSRYIPVNIQRRILRPT